MSTDLRIVRLYRLRAAVAVVLAREARKAGQDEIMRFQMKTAQFWSRAANTLARVAARS